MIGDSLLIKEHHTKIAKKIVAAIGDEIQKAKKKGAKYVITIGGESGSGKSETAHEMLKVLNEKGIGAENLTQDDYFVFPPKTNAMMRRNDIKWVGPHEVKLDFLDANLMDFKNGASEIYKPLVNFENDTIEHQIMDVTKFDVLIVDGTYTTILRFADKRIFIDRSYINTREDRVARGREEVDAVIEQVLEIEHRIVQSHKVRADILILPDFSDIELR